MLSRGQVGQSQGTRGPQAGGCRAVDGLTTRSTESMAANCQNIEVPKKKESLIKRSVLSLEERNLKMSVSFIYYKKG